MNIRYVNSPVSVPEFILVNARNINVFRSLSEVLITPYDTFAGQGLYVGGFVGEDGVSYTALGIPMSPTIY